MLHVHVGAQVLKLTFSRSAVFSGYFGQNIEGDRNPSQNRETHYLVKCQGTLNFFKVMELSGNFMICRGKMKFSQNVREFYISVM